ncbi:MAG: threonine synthase [Candidatus Dormibacteria bacterium]
MDRPGVILRYGARLDLSEATPRITLNEGSTPCIESRAVGPALGLRSLHFKFEGLNPTGSFKDRGMVVAVARAMERGSDTIVCASTGNTSASAAAYGARFGLRTLVIIPTGHVAAGKLVQAQVHGARVVAVEGNFDAALRAVRSLCEGSTATLVNSVNPARIAGQKTAAFEIVDELGDAPDVLAIPVGNAGNITAYWRGFREYFDEGLSRRLPRMVGGQAAGAAPLVTGYAVERPETIATAIRIGNPASWTQALVARDESEGLIDSVSDDQICLAQRELATSEGIFCEPASAASLAVLVQSLERGRVDRGSRVVCVLTGNGLKDTGAVSGALITPRVVGGGRDELADLLGL